MHAMYPSVLSISSHGAIRTRGTQLAESLHYIFTRNDTLMSNEKNANLLDRRTFFLGTAGALALGTTACGGGSGGSSFSPIGGAAAQQTPAAVAGVDSPITPEIPAAEPPPPEPAAKHTERLLE